MKKLIILLVFVSLSGSLLSNPLPPPPFISELYWDETGWTMELYFLDLPCEANYLDEFFLVCNDDTSAFVSGIPVELFQIIVITSDDLTEPFDIPIEGGRINLFYGEDFFPVAADFLFGDYPSSWVSPVVPGQSITTQKFIIGRYDIQFWLVKETQPSIGDLPFTCQTRADFSGMVLDKTGLPVPNAIVSYTFANTNDFDPPVPEIITDVNGVFSTNQMFCRKYTLRIFVDNEMELITQLNIEPDSANYFEFVLDSLHVGINSDVYAEPKISINTRPNPFNRNLDINIQMNRSILIKSSQLKLYDLNGNMLKSTVINSPYLNNIDIHWEAMNEIVMNSGVYMLVLEVEDKIMATQKVVFQK